jgi:NAD+ diphosphatase
MSVPSPPPEPVLNPFSSAVLQRRAELRSDAEWLAGLLADPACLVLVARGGLQLAQREPARLVMLDSMHSQVRRADRGQFSLLGWFRDMPCLLLDVGDSDFEPPAGATFEETRGLLSQLSDGEASLALMARGLQLWRPRHRHCGVCGTLTEPRNAGHSLRCTAAECAAEFFPRIDPAVIVAVSDGPHVLLGRQPSWPRGRYSTLAGFVEVGESLEDAVIREVREEAGVDCHAPRYFGSQAWPFPSSLMLGFHASATHSPIILDDELEDARWFSPAELEQMSEALLPPPFTIARRLIDHWYRGVAGHGLDGQP